MPIKNRNLFRLTRFILLKLPYILQVLAKFKKPAKKILIIKTDAIGDYILFRNFIEEVKKVAQFQDYQIDLIGNILWQDVALKYDKNFVFQFYFVNANDLYHQPLQVLKLAWKLFCQNYSLVLQPSYTRNFINDGLAALTAAKQIIGFEGDFEAITQKIKKKTDQFYTKKIVLPTSIYFEFDRTQFFFETVLKKQITLKGPSLPVESFTQNYVAFCLGAGNQKRSWEATKFLSLAQLILQQTNYNIYLLGSLDAASDTAFIGANLSSERVKNLSQKTTLSEFIQIIAQSALVICNETSAVHIASACGKKVVSVLGGGHFERFAPYPIYFINKPVFLFEKMPCYHCNWLCKFETAVDEPFPCISNVTLNQVWKEVKQLLNIN